MDLPVLTARDCNRALLARQQLLTRCTLPLETLVERLGGLQTQNASSAYVGLWSRLAGFHRDGLTAALHEARIVQGWVMRATIHMVSAADYRPLTEAVRVARRDTWRRLVKPPAELDMDAVAAAVRRHLVEGPLRDARLRDLLAADGFAPQSWPGAQLWVDLVRVPPAGTWGSPRAHRYGLAEQWLPATGDALDADAAAELIVERYLGGYGPASAQDVARFCGWRIPATRAVLARMAVRRLRDEAGVELFDLPGAPLPPADTPAPVRFLGPYDATLLLGHARRAQILPREYRRRVFATTMPRSVPTFLVDGRVAGTWRHVAGEIRWEAFHELPGAAAAELAGEAERLAELFRP